MSEEPARVPSVDQLVEVHQSLWWFLDRSSWAPTIKQEEEVLPRFERLSDALAPVRPLVGSIEGWPTKIKRSLRGIISAFDETTRLWGWEWIDKPKAERSAYLKERRALLDKRLEAPILEAARFLSDQWSASDHCPYDDLADEARHRGFVPRRMTIAQAHAQFREAKARFNSEPRFGKCSPKIAEGEYETLCTHWHTMRAELMSLVSHQVERPPWQEQPEAGSLAAAQTDRHEESTEPKSLPEAPFGATRGTGKLRLGDPISYYDFDKSWKRGRLIGEPWDLTAALGVRVMPGPFGLMAVEAIQRATGPGMWVLRGRDCTTGNTLYIRLPEKTIESWLAIAGYDPPADVRIPPSEAVPDPSELADSVGLRLVTPSSETIAFRKNDRSIKGPSVILGGADDEVTVCGRRKAPLPPAQYRVVKALVEAKAEGRRLTKDQLHTQTRDESGNCVEDPIGALKRLIKDSDWKEVVDMAKKPGRGYSIRDCPPTPTQKNPQSHPRRPRGG
jgi:hypothetical protein